MLNIPTKYTGKTAKSNIAWLKHVDEVNERAESRRSQRQGGNASALTNYPSTYSKTSKGGMTASIGGKVAASMGDNK